MGWKSLVIFISVTVVTGQLQESRIINNSNRDRPPVLLPKGDLRDFQLFENIPVGTHVYTLKGQDPEGGSVRYTISGDYFSADSVTGKLTLVKELDRELLSEINVVITVQDEQNIVPASRRIKVLDRNDNAPQFLGSPYSFTVAETESVGQTVYTEVKVTDADEGQNSEVQLSCDAEKSSPDACDTFDIFASPLGPGEYLGLIVLKKPLNYEDRSSYNLVVEARDGGEDEVLTATTDIIISVEDIQDQDPIFLNGPYSATVAEGTQPGQPIFEIQVRDGDTGIPRPLELSVIGDKLEYFRLVEETVSPDGILSVTLVTTENIIDREHPDVLKEGGLYPFQILAREVISDGVYGEQTKTSVTIVVTDIDDELPIFNRNSVTVPVPEDVGSDTPLPGLTLEVIDKDVSKNAEFSLLLEPVSLNSEGVFYIYPEKALGKTPVIIRVKDPERLDYENEDARNFKFNVVAVTASGQQIKSEIEVVVTDANDNIPQFQEKSYEFTVAEDARAGFVIGTIEASDPDSGSYGEIIYTIKGFGSEKFTVRPETGEVMVAACGSDNEIIPGDSGRSCLDYEERKTFSLTYTATDGGGQTTTTNLLIRLQDVNDNHPRFDRDEYRRVVRESDASFDPPLYIRATDSDGPLQGGGKVFYTIQSINTDATVFQIDPVTGELTMTKPVRTEDTENGRYDLVVRATDQGKPQPLYSDVKVFVDVGSIRNQKPKFSQQEYSLVIRENAQAGSDVLRVAADDPDGDNNGLRFSIHSGSKDNFVMDSKTGVITVADDADLSLEQNGELYEMVVKVTDDGDPYQQTSSSLVTITVEDVNNISPSFSQDSYTEYVLENEPRGHVVLTVSAQDPDRDADLEYDIVEPIIARDKSGTKLENIAAYNFKQAFNIDPRTGRVSINEKLSYSSAAVIILTLQVRDLNAEDNVESQVDLAEATLYIKAYNADNPTFPAPWTPSDPTFTVNISENMPPGQPFFNLAAKDPLTGQPINQYQKLDNESPLSDLIQISSFGDVISQQMLDFEQVKSIQFSVSAIAGPVGSERVSEAHVTLQLVDANDNAPVFERSSYQAEIPEDSLPLTSVATVHATDADTGEFGRVVYGLQGEGSNEFMIDENTGVIKVRPSSQGRSSLDREWVESYKLRVVARDMPNGGSDQKTSAVMVTVNLLDVNDSPPEFSQSRYTAVVPENSPVGTQVAQVAATDPDLDNQVMYDFSNPSQINNLYKIDRNNGKIYTNDILTGKGRREPYMISVRALDSGTPQQFSDTELYITVGDVSRNDGVPEFINPQPGDEAVVLEEASVGSAVYHAVASDPDDPNTANGKIVYSFPDDGTIVRKLFQIDSNTGLITTRVALDREERDQYTLILEARDLGSPVQQTSRLLNVIVKDIDDHPPKFNRQKNSVPLSMEVEEELPIGSKIGEVNAIDRDIGENAVIDYAIIYGNDDGVFGIERDENNKGIISLRKRLDREQGGLHVLSIKCFEPSDQNIRNLRKPYDKMKLDEIQVKIHVIDQDDNNPTFTEKNMTRGVRVNAPIYTEIGRVTATDADAEADMIKYKLENVTFVRPSTGYRRQLGASAFLVDPLTGVIQTNQSYGRYSDGYFDVVIKAHNSPDPSRMDLTFMKVFVLQDTDLMKFVFDKNPVNVAKEMREFKEEVEAALAQPLTLNVYDNEFYSKVDGSLDFGRTSSCFQVLDSDEDVVDLDKVNRLFDNRRNRKLAAVFSKYSVNSVERCSQVRTAPKVDWIQILILIIAVFIGVAAFVATITICCLYSKYKRRIRRSNIKIVEAPVRALIPASLPPGSVMGPAPSLLGQANNPSVHGSNGRIYEWQETAMPIDTASYRSLPR